MSRKKGNKGEAMELSFLSWWVIGIAVLIISFIIIFLNRESISNAIKFLFDKLRFG